MRSDASRRFPSFFAFAVSCLLAAACASSGERGPIYSTTYTVQVSPSDSIADSRRQAFAEAERLARDQIARMALGELRFANGMTLEDAVVTDPVIRARVYDTIRTARITDRTIDEDGTRVSITMELDHGPLLRIINAGAAPPPPGP